MMPPMNWDEIRRLTEMLEVQLHLAGMDARDRWHELAPRVVEVETKLVRAGKRGTTVVARELASLAAALRRLRADMART